MRKLLKQDSDSLNFLQIEQFTFSIVFEQSPLEIINLLLTACRKFQS